MIKPITKLPKELTAKTRKKTKITEGILCLFSDQMIKKLSNTYPFKKIVDELNYKRIFKAYPNEYLLFEHHNLAIVLFGIGKADKLNLTDLRIYLKTAVQNKSLPSKLTVIPHKDDPQIIRAIIDGISIGGYKWNKYKPKSKNKPQLKQINILTQHTAWVKQMATITEGTNLTRDLTNENANIINSIYLEKKIKQITASDSRFKVKVVNQAQMKKLGMNLFLGVNQASQYPPKLLIVEYNGDPIKNTKRGAESKSSKKSKNSPKTKNTYTAFLGKGITFDSGGLNLKPTGSIESMKTDMAGAAAIIGLLSNTVKLKPKQNLIFACAIAENMISEKSYKPGDVIKSYSGKTVEILNTDAEGRLILADSISYLCKHYELNTLIDIATLTGACVYALGFDHAGLITNSDKLANKLRKLGTETDDRVWRLPYYPKLMEHIKSNIADIKNTGQNRSAGTISAAAFLKAFVKKGVNWAHIDIAGTGRAKTDYWYYNQGSTGAGVRLLTSFIME